MSGTATASPVQRVSGAGEGVAFGVASASEVIPLIRGDRLGLDYYDSESFDLDADSDNQP